MIKAIERATGNEYKAERIDEGFNVFTMEGKPYKKLKESTFKRNFKVTGEVIEEKKEIKKPEPEKKVEKKQESKKAEPKKEAKNVKKEEPHKELSPEQREKMIDKIRKVLKLAQDNPSMEEGLAAALQAQKLMAKYNIHEDDVSLEEIKDEIGSVFSTQKHNSHLKAWRKNLAMVISRNFRCKCYMRGQDVVFRGYKKDAEIAMEVYLSLYEICRKLGTKAHEKQKAEEGTGKGAHNSFALGFVRGVEEGLGEQCTALMIVTPKEVEEEYVTFSAGFGKSRGMSTNNIDGKLYAQGKVEGKAAIKSHGIEKKGGK